MHKIIYSSIWFVLCIISGVIGVVSGYQSDNIFNLVIGCINIFLSGIFAMIVYVEIIFYRHKKKGEIK